MDGNEKIEERKQFNKNFLKAFDHLKNEKHTTQDILAKMLNTNSSYISACRKGLKKVGEDLMERLARAYNGRLNIHYLRNESQYMLLSNVTDDEIIENLRREDNPDYDIMKTHETEKSKQQRINDRAQEVQLEVLGHIIKESEAKEGVAADDTPRPYLPPWADTLLAIISKQIAENEVLHQELEKTIQLMKHYFEQHQTV